ncbi:MAG: tRNA pseudouridine(55) synthase TruB [Bacteroidales bacterium]|jgi:tRNA pseudouridine55 synthase|nr:tRNA pseudouridine(55) synthase TruB [Bacteroidales bacterium]
MVDIENGCVLLVDKPYTWTSFQCVKKIKFVLSKHYNKKIKIGHAGTLDPLATGLLLVCVGKYTKRIEEFQDLDKQYSGTFFLGKTTKSYDLEQPIDATFPINHIKEEDIYNVAKDFLGNKEQIPPIYSAKWIDGKRAYTLARENSEEIKLKPKQITIKEFEITSINFPQVSFRIVCSKGTYIRSIARDFGLALNTGAYLSSLSRDRIGDFKIEDAIKIDNIYSILE